MAYSGRITRWLTFFSLYSFCIFSNMGQIICVKILMCIYFAKSLHGDDFTIKTGAQFFFVVFRFFLSLQLNCGWECTRRKMEKSWELLESEMNLAMRTNECVEILQQLSAKQALCMLFFCYLMAFECVFFSLLLDALCSSTICKYMSVLSHENWQTKTLRPNDGDIDVNETV